MTRLKYLVILIVTLFTLPKPSISNNDNTQVANAQAKLSNTEKELLDKEYGVRYADACEVCKYLSIELEDRFEKLGQTSQVIETGYQIDGPKKRIKYTRSELYFIEALEQVCDGLLKYNIHKERNDSTRFDKSMSQTFQTLHNLKDKGVKVDLGIPEELWDSPSAEITALKNQCENQLEQHHDIIEQWYWGARDQKLRNYLCRDRVLPKDQRACLDDPTPPKAIESEIPAQVLYKIHHKSDITPPRREKVVKFYHDNKVRSDQSTTITEESSSTDGEEVVIAKFTHQDDNEPSSSFSESPKWAKEPSSPATPSLPVKPATKRKVSDAIVQTNSDVQYRAASTQTDESLENRPLSMTIDKMQPLDIQSFAPIRAIPKNRSGYIPPLRIGLTLKGKKRKVYYPDDDEDSNANAA